MKKLRLLIAVILCTPFVAHTQETDSTILKQFIFYRDQAFTEKVYIHTDRDYYIAGEIIWWKLYYVDGYFHLPAHLSKVVYVEVLDNNNRPILQTRAALDTGGSNGSFYLPLSASSGVYTIRAYTNWMKNFDADYYFSKQITIVNTFKAVPVQNVSIEDRYDAGFFPEGGNMVRGIESRIAFRVTDQYGRGLDFNGWLLDENNDTIVAFQPLRNGIGNFTFTPLGKHNYHASIRLRNGKSIIPAFPEIAEYGHVMRLSEDDNKHLRITVSTNTPSAREAYMLVHTRHVIKTTAKAAFYDGKATFMINVDSLGEGISQLTVFDGRRQPVCERLYFVYPRHKLKIESTGNTGRYGIRKKVRLSLQTTMDSQVTPASVSLAVYLLDSLRPAVQDNIQSYFWLTSDLKGTVESPSAYFADSTANTKKAMDNLMLTHGWRRFSWNAMTDSLKISYQPEFDGHILSARVLDASDGHAVKEISTYLSIPGPVVQFYPAISDSTGKVHFDIRDYYGPGEIVLQSDTNSVTRYRFEVANPYSEILKTKYQTKPFLTGTRAVGSLSKASFAMQVQNIYSADSLSRFILPLIDTTSFYGRHGTVYNLDEYTRFTSIEEVLREYVTEVGIRLKNGQRRLMIVDILNRGFFLMDPIILLDGVPMSHASILAFDPLKVSKLQVVAAPYRIGSFLYDGVVSFSTYHRSVEDIPLSTRATVLNYEGLQLKREFFSPLYETEKQVANRLPDYRNLLYWSPDVKTGKVGSAAIEFYTSDVDGKYVVIMEGMDNKGDTGMSSSTFEVTKP